MRRSTKGKAETATRIGQGYEKGRMLKKSFIRLSGVQYSRYSKEKEGENE